jgi:hypothetical protein
LQGCLLAVGKLPHISAQGCNGTFISELGLKLIRDSLEVTYVISCSGYEYEPMDGRTKMTRGGTVSQS